MSFSTIHKKNKQRAIYYYDQLVSKNIFYRQILCIWISQLIYGIDIVPSKMNTIKLYVSMFVKNQGLIKTVLTHSR